MSRSAKWMYIALLVFLLVLPHFIVDDIFFLPEAYAESILICVLLGIGALFYYLHLRDLRMMEAELELSSDKLNDAYKYIGLVNRRLPLLKHVTTDLLRKSETHKQGKKEIFEQLLATAVTSLLHTTWGIFRFIDVESERTVREFMYTDRNYVLLKTEVSNHALLQSRAQADPQKIGEVYVVSTVDPQTATPCFFIFPLNTEDTRTVMPVVQSIVDQAQVFYKYFY